MSDSARATADGRSRHQLGLALSLTEGRGLLTVRDRALPPFQLKYLKLETPELSFPFDVTGGINRFKTHLLKLSRLAFSMDAADILGLFPEDKLTQTGFSGLSLSVEEGGIRICGRFRHGPHEASFRIRAAVVIRSNRDLDILFFEPLVFGWLPLPAAALPVALKAAWGNSFVGGQAAGRWEFTPIESFLQWLLPSYGWKIPDTRGVCLSTAEVGRGRILIAAGAEGNVPARQIARRQPEREAISAVVGVDTFHRAECLLAAGDFKEAFAIYRAAVQNRRGGAWARARCLDLGVALMEHVTWLQGLAQSMLEMPEESCAAELSLASMALHEGQWRETHDLYVSVASRLRAEGAQFEALAADLAAAESLARVDTASALGAYERIVGDVPSCVDAVRSVFALACQTGQWPRAIWAGERLLRELPTKEEQAEQHRALGDIHLRELRAYSEARGHYEQALLHAPTEAQSLEGLGECLLRLGEPARAVALWTEALAHVGAENVPARVRLNQRLALVWQHELGNAEQAAEFFTRTLDLAPNHPQALVSLATLAEALGEPAKARGLYEDVLALENASECFGAEVLADISYRLGKLMLTTQTSDLRAVACFRRSLELWPAQHRARAALVSVYQESGQWDLLAEELTKTSTAAADPKLQRWARLQRAKLDEQFRDQVGAACGQYRALCAENPTDADAREGYVRTLLALGKDEDAAQALVDAAETTGDSIEQAQFWLRAASLWPARQEDLWCRALERDAHCAEAAEGLRALYQERNDAAGRCWVLERQASFGEPKERALLLVQAAELYWNALARHRDAEAAFDQALATDPEHGDTYAAYVHYLKATGQTDKAAVILERGVHALGPGHKDTAPLHLARATLAKERGSLAEEERALALALVSAPLPRAASARHAELLEELGRPDEAIEYLERGIALDPGHMALRLHAAALHRRAGKSKEARRVLEPMLHHEGPEALDAAQRLAELYASEGDLLGLSDVLQVQLRAGSALGKPRVLAELVALHEKRGAVDVAAQWSRELLALDPASAVAHGQLARLYEAQGSLSQALTHLGALVFGCPKDALPRRQRRAVIEYAAALAQELRPDMLPALRRVFELEFPQVPAELLQRRLGAQLEKEGRWAELLALRHEQLGSADDARAQELRIDIARTLHQKLRRTAEAIAFYRLAVARAPTDALGEEFLAALSELGRWDECAELCLGLYRKATDHKRTQYWGLLAARQYLERLSDRVVGHQILAELIARAANPAQLDHMSQVAARHGIEELRADVLERSMELAPGVDGRLTELVQRLMQQGRASSAVERCEQMVEAFPESDTPRELLVSILERHRELGSRFDAMWAWAEGRIGPARAHVLSRLAAVQTQHGNLAEAAEIYELAWQASADASYARAALDVLSTLQWWPELVPWYRRLIDRCETPEQPEHDELWRHIHEVAQHTADTELRYEALRNLEKPFAEEQAELAHAALARRDLRVLSRLDSVLAQRLGADAVFETIDLAITHGELELAERLLLEGARLDRRRASRISHEPWRQAGRLAALGQKRLGWARVLPSQVWLTLQGYAECYEGGGDPPDIGISDLVSGLSIDDETVAWALYYLGRVLQREAWQSQGARALQAMLPESDVRLWEVLRTNIKADLEAGHLDTALSLVARLEARGDAGFEEWLEKQLVRAGRLDAWIAYLEMRALREPARAGPAWLRLAAHHQHGGRLAQALDFLQRIPEAERNYRWAELSYALGEALHDASMRAEAATLLSRYSDGVQKARWLRVAGRALWWELADPAAGAEMLREAQRIDPLPVAAATSAILEALAQDNHEEAWHRAEEALLCVDERDSAPLWLQVATLAWRAGQKLRSQEATERAVATLGPDPALWLQLAQIAQAQANPELVLQCLETAHGLDPEHEGELIAVLTERGAFKRVVEVLTTAAARHTGEASARRYEHAARVAARDLSDPERALMLWQHAIVADPGDENLREATRLAQERKRHDLVAHWTPQALERLATQDPARPELLRVLLSALDALGLAAQREPALRDLHTFGEATRDEALELAAITEGTVPELAASIYSEYGEAEGDPALLMKAARLRADIGELSQAKMLLERVPEAAQEQAWVLLYESILERGEPLGLPAFWLRAAELCPSAWPREELARKLADAARAFSVAGNLASEMQALRSLHDIKVATRPELDRLAELYVHQGQRAPFLELAQEGIAQTATAQEHTQRVLSCAAVLETRFSDADAALALLLAHAVTTQGASLTHALVQRLVSRGRADEALGYLVREAERSQLLSDFEQAGRLAQGAAGAPAKAYGLYARILSREPDEPPLGQGDLTAGAEKAARQRARRFCIEFSVRERMWLEALAWLSGYAELAADAAERLRDLEEAIGIARRELLDPARELELLERALEIPGGARAELLARALDLYLEQNREDAIVPLLSHERFRGLELLPLATTLLPKLQRQSRAQHETLQEWLGERFPDSAAGLVARISRARTARDTQRLVALLEQRLATDSGLTSVDRAFLSVEICTLELVAPSGRALLPHFVAAAAPLAERPLEVALDVAPAVAAWLSAHMAEDQAQLGLLLDRLRAMLELCGQATSQARTELSALALLAAAQLHEQAGRIDEAVLAYRHVVTLRSGQTEPATDALVRLLSRKEDWLALVEHLGQLAHGAQSSKESAQHLTTAALIWLNYIGDELRAKDSLRLAIDLDPACRQALVSLGMLELQDQAFALAHGHLLAALPSDGARPTELLRAIVVCAERLGDHREALALSDEILAKPQSGEALAALHAVRGRCFERLGRDSEAEAAWDMFLATADEARTASDLASAFLARARRAQKRGDFEGARTDARQALHHGAQGAAHQILAQACEALQRWPQAAEAWAEVAQAAHAEHDEELEVFARKASARIYDEKLHAQERVVAQLTLLPQAARDEPEVADRLLAAYEETGALREYAELAERRLVIRGAPAGDGAAELYGKLAAALLASGGDEDRALGFYSQALSLRPDDERLHATFLDASQRSGRFEHFVATESELFASGRLSDLSGLAGPERLETLTAVLVQQGALDRAVELVTLVVARTVDERCLRLLAELGAQAPAHYATATTAYRQLLASQPLDEEMLLLTARLLGHQGDVDGAYSVYAALWSTQPDNDEAAQYVRACRAEPPPIPTGWPELLPVVEHGVEVSALDALLSWLAWIPGGHEVEAPGGTALELAGDELRVWQHILACFDLPLREVVLSALAPSEVVIAHSTVAIGTTVWEQPISERLFRVTRAASLCAHGFDTVAALSSWQRRALILRAAKALGVTTPLQDDSSLPEWCTRIEAHAAEAPPELRDVAEQAVQLEAWVHFERWLMLTMARANRHALLSAGDAELAVRALLRLEGRPLSALGRATALARSLQTVELLRFAVSEGYSVARHQTGVAVVAGDAS